ncbi:TatD family hydrolase [Desulfobulbus sp. US1]|uniref:TatD DNase family protein n=1 Tax=Candidatus Electrothrix communis TaxID=1859133 RepID=A0A444J669_9BACT|nr:TatD family hydrolase [Desulfobulbus sp. US4]MCW5207945.1 TatD family hydrolase [Desulfobulbus sp. US2]MCW5209008.1 TatD family hydrolase [Desulfobulbus sp. US1]RWX48562.1 TatD DNase family protein [Candidatus Electrothrix communis]
MKQTSQPPALSLGYGLIDSHCHLDMETSQDAIDDIIGSAKQCHVHTIITIGIDLASSQRAVELAHTYPGVYASVGIHPHSAEEGDDAVYQQLKELATSKKMVAYGEIGLDYAKQYAPVERQRLEFTRQLKIAKELELPIIIHDREAHEDTVHIIKEQGPFPASGVMHCFSGNMAFAHQVLDLGLYISIPGIVTFKNASDLQKVAREIPLNRMLLETDGPFLAPVPFRGKRNRPEYLLYTAAMVAELRGISIDEVARQTSRNTQQLFSLPDQGDEQ